MRTVALVVGSGFALVFIIVFMRTFFESVASRHWRPVPGKVRQVVIEHHARPGGADLFSARVDYEYVFEGRPERDCKSLGRSTVDRDEAVGYGRAYAAGQQIDVFVDPARPRKSTLRRGANYGYLVPVVFGIGMLVFFLSRLLQDS